MSKKRNIFPIIGLIVCLITCALGITILCSIHVDMIAILQYPSLNEEKVMESIDKLSDRLESSDEQIASTVCVKSQHCLISSSFCSDTATLYGIEQDYSDFRFNRIIKGRGINYSDIMGKDMITVIGEETAFSLFEGHEAIGQIVLINGKEYTVVGICSDGKELGEADDCLAYIPLSVIDQAEMKFDTLEYLIHTGNSHPSQAIAESILREWNDDITIYSFRQKKTMAMIPLIITLICLGIEGIRRISSKLFRKVNQINTCTHRLLDEHYLRESIPEICGSYVPCFLAATGLVACCICLVRLVLKILMVFPEWIPGQLTCLSSWVDLFWRFTRQHAESVFLSCKELSAANMAAIMIRGSTLIGMICLVLWSVRAYEK